MEALFDVQRHWAGLAIAKWSPINLDDRNDFRGGAGDEAFLERAELLEPPSMRDEYTGILRAMAQDPDAVAGVAQ